MSSPFITTSPFSLTSAVSPQGLLQPNLNPYSMTSNMSSLSSTLNLNTTDPYLVVHENIDNDPMVIKRVNRYFYYKTLDKWLYDDLSYILKYFKVSGDKVDLIEKRSQYENNKVDSSDDKEKIVRFIEKEILKRKDMKKILKKFLKKNKHKSAYGGKLTWSELMKTQYSLKKFIGKRLKKHLNNIIPK
jgi:hypothetical protein